MKPKNSYISRIDNSSLTIIIPSFRSLMQIILFALGIIMIVCFDILTIFSLLKNGNNLLWSVVIFITLIIIIMWTAEILWQLAGKEVIHINEHELVISHRVYLMWLSRKMQLRDIKEIRFSPLDNPFFLRSRDLSFWSFKYGKITVSDGKRILRFGYSLRNDDEANEILKIIMRFDSLDLLVGQT